MVGVVSISLLIMVKRLFQEVKGGMTNNNHINLVIVYCHFQTWIYVKTFPVMSSNKEEMEQYPFNTVYHFGFKSAL